MSNWRKFTAIALVICVVHSSVADLATARGTKSSVDSTGVKRKVEMLGVGSKVEADVEGGDRIRARFN